MSVTLTPTGKPSWSREANIGDYGGSSDKRESATEGAVPYAWSVYRELVAMKGSAYNSTVGTLVHAQNLAKARMLGFSCFRMPEMLRANNVPASAGDGLAHWVKVLAIPSKSSDQKWQLRQRAAAHFKAITDVSLPAIQTALSELLGEAYVGATFKTGASMASPPDYTYWPGVNDGPSDHNLGGGTWASIRCHLFVDVTQPVSVTLAEFNQLMRVQLVQLLDRTLPAYCTWDWATGGNFILGASRLGYDEL